ncbi:MAG: putative DNA binding domain-containing protein [Lentisphaeraceae bacterium]|nr:putative DNA binding domain-containing protein [Lentisphaeraceae bacterium]
MKDYGRILDELLSNGHEGECLEFKAARNNFDKGELGKYFSALSNEANLKSTESAWLIFGIEDKTKNVLGTNYCNAVGALEKIKREVSENISNKLSFRHIAELEREGKRLLLFEIPAAPQGIPIAWKGHYHARVGESLTAMDIDKIERIRAQVKTIDWSAGLVKSASLDDLCPDALLLARKGFKTKNSRLVEEIDTWDDLTFLNKAKLLIKGKITRAALILLGKEESNHFLEPGTAQVSWILKDRDNFDKDYEHFFCPLISVGDKIYHKIRNLKYRYMKDGTLFPEEVDQYDPWSIREALHNCIAHQDYTLGSKVLVVEKEDELLFSNAGKFIPESVEEVVLADAPEFRYRNKFLADAMVNLNLIDTIGSGIRKMFDIQRHKFFPMPEYKLENNRVSVSIIGKVVDLAYANKLASESDLNFSDIILLDKVAKHKELSKEQTRALRSKKLIEGRAPNIHISLKVAQATGEINKYLKQRGIDDEYCQKIILDYLTNVETARKADFEELLINKLPDVLDIEQKRNKIKNNLQTLRALGRIKCIGWEWSKV